MAHSVQIENSEISENLTLCPMRYASGNAQLVTIEMREIKLAKTGE